MGALVQWTVLSRPPSSQLAAGQPDVQVVADVDLYEPSSPGDCHIRASYSISC